MEDLDPTRGIDNKLVDTLVDIRPISMAAWKEVNPQDQAKKDDTLLVTSVIGVLDREGVLANQQAQSVHTKEPDEIEISEEQLLTQIEEAVTVFEQPLEDPPPQPSPPPHSLVTPPHHEATPMAQQQPQLLPPPKSTRQTTPSLSSKPEEEPKSQNPNVPRERDPNPTQPSRTQPSRTQPRRTQPSQPSRTQPSRTQPSHTAPKEVPRASGALISRRLHQSVGRMIKTSTPPTQKEPTLHLNTYDFAGQKQYRPMHHCFITRRALYLIVFNLQHMVKYLNDKGAAKINPLEEIRYWLNSIHAHIHKPTEDKETKRVYLVGTHKAPKKTKHGKPLSESDLKKIHDALDSVFGEDTRTVNHLCYSCDHKQIFAAIENSLDGAGEGEREASGIAALQNDLMKICGVLPFLQKQYPILWLRFERGLLQLREEYRGSKTPPLIKLEEVQKMAQTCCIEESDSNHALHFFHDTGTIVCLSKSVVAID